MIMKLAVAGILLLGLADPPTVETGQHDRTATITLRDSRVVLSGDGLGGGKRDGYRVRRPCWYEPSDRKTADLLRTYRRTKDLLQRQPVYDEKELDAIIKKIEEAEGKEGRWWVPAYVYDDPNGYACWSGLERFVWVPPGTTPPAGITMAELMDIARAALTVPEPRVELNPDARSYVNLPTWVWLDGVGDTTRSVTATLPGVMSATVTATLGDIEIDSGTTGDRAEVVESGCGPRGRPYAKGAEFTCGVRYLRASVDQPRKVYELTVTSVWEVGAAGQGGGGVAPFAYDPIEVGVTRDVPVGEVQSVVRGG
ncbi:hypothetical protein [Planomonospora algeriensis]